MLSVIIIIKNEAHHLHRCLSALSFADQIIILDSGSTDGSVDIAKQYTPHVYETDWQGYGVQKQRALSYATGDWVLNIDADEWVSESLAKEISRAIKSNQHDAYRIPIYLEFYGQMLKYSYSPSRHVRLFKRDGAKYSQDFVHEKILLKEGVRIGQLKEGLAHRSFNDLSHAIDKLNRYSSTTAHMRLEAGKKASTINTIAKSVWMFVRSYILQGGFLDGRAGFLMCVYNAQGSFFRGMKQMYPDQKERLKEL